MTRSGIPVLLTRRRPLKLLILKVQTALHPGRPQAVHPCRVALILLVRLAYLPVSLGWPPILARTLVVPCSEDMVKKPEGTRNRKAAVLLEGWKEDVTSLIGPIGPF